MGIKLLLQKNEKKQQEKRSFEEALKKLKTVSAEARKNAEESVQDLEKRIEKESKNIDSCLKSVEKIQLLASVKSKMELTLRELKESFLEAPTEIGKTLDSLNAVKFRIVLFGRTMVGKSTLLEILTNGKGDGIGKGAQRTTLETRKENWRGLEIVDVPGTCAVGGEKDTEIAMGEARKADLIVFMIADAPQKEELNYFVNLIEVGKPVICLMNIKQRTPDPSSPSFERDVGRLKRKFQDVEYSEIEKQFNDFLREKNPGRKDFRFLRVHLRSYFEGRLKRNDILKDLSNFKSFLYQISLLVSKEAQILKFRNFLDAAISPSIRLAYCLLKKTEEELGYEKIVMGKAKELDFWCRDNFFPSNRRKASKFISEKKTFVRAKIQAFCEENYDNNNAGKEWSRYYKSFKIEDDLERLFQEIGEILSKKFNSSMREIDFDFKFCNISSSGEKITNWKSLLGWVGTVLTSIGDILCSTPIGWVLMVAGRVLFVFNIMSDSKSNKIKKAVKEMSKAIEGQMNKHFEKMRKYLDEGLEILESRASDLIGELKVVSKIIHNTSSSQKEFASWLLRESSELSKNLVLKILSENGVRDFEKNISLVVRFPGRFCIILLKGPYKDFQYIQKIVGTSLRESTYLIKDVSNPEFLFARIRGASRLFEGSTSEDSPVKNIIFETIKSR